MGIEDIASVVEHDVTVDSVFEALPKVGTVDVITMSYSYSMIPDQAGVLRNATKLLKKGGYLALENGRPASRSGVILPPIEAAPATE